MNESLYISVFRLKCKVHCIFWTYFNLNRYFTIKCNGTCTRKSTTYRKENNIIQKETVTIDYNLHIVE